jgi:Arc/MetJ-type ribon-helix-helix transcriptional regulator
MNVISVRIPRELKKKMDSLRGVVNWREEIRRFIERRVREIEQERVIGELEKLIQELPPAPKGYAARLVREDRDSG